MSRIYLSIGSNIGDRQMYLQLAVGLITYRIGKVEKLSSILETPAWGFEGNAFYNACLAVDTSLDPQEILEELLSIEVFLGRERKTAEGYQARTIDLDLLLHENKVVDTPQLSVPHPRMEIRNFVLVPLAEIAPNVIHPVLKKSIHQLLKDSPDNAVLTKVSHRLFLPKRKHFIAIEGNIGVGKTSFTHQLQAALGGTLLLENFYDNPYLVDFYQDPEKFALKVETAFLTDRIEQLSSFFDQKNDLPIVADFSLEKSLLFAQQNLSKTDFTSYKEDYKKNTQNLPQPELVLFLDQRIEQLQKNIEKRGRDFEQEIQKDYLKKIGQGYKDWQKNSALNIHIINTKDMDFVHKTSDFHHLLLCFFKVELLIKVPTHHPSGNGNI